MRQIKLVNDEADEDEHGEFVLEKAECAICVYCDEFDSYDAVSIK